MSLAGYTVERIDYRRAMSAVVGLHYLHREPPCTHAFGLFDHLGRLCGVCIYGTPSSAPLRRGIAGDEHKNNVIELTRLWVHDGVPKNGESLLIGRTLPLLDKEIVVAFADTSQGHLGIVYQASNWLYTGLSAKRTDWTVEGLDRHGQTIADRFTASEVREKYGEAFSLTDRPRKHRYIYLRGTKRRCRELRSALRYQVLPYPKRAAGLEEKNPAIQLGSAGSIPVRRSTPDYQPTVWDELLRAGA
jgi:hypothetical protein